MNIDPNKTSFIDLSQYRATEENLLEVAKTLEENALELAIHPKETTVISEINLNFNDISLVALSALAKPLMTYNYVTDLWLEGINLRGSGAKIIARLLTVNNSLTFLGLENTGLKDKEAIIIAKALEANTKLVGLSLRINEIRDAGALAIGDALSQNSSLQYLCVGGNRINNKGIRRIAKALEINSTLTTFNCHVNSFTDDGILRLIKMMRKNSTLSSIIIYSTHGSVEYESELSALAYRNQQNTHRRTTTLRQHIWKMIYNSQLGTKEEIQRLIPPDIIKLCWDTFVMTERQAHFNEYKMHRIFRTGDVTNAWVYEPVSEWYLSKQKKLKTEDAEG